MASATRNWGEWVVTLVAAAAMAACAAPAPDGPTEAGSEALAGSAVSAVGVAEAVDVASSQVVDLKVRTDHLATMGLAVARPYKDGDLCTYDAQAWGAACDAEAPAGCIRAMGFASLYGAEFRVGWQDTAVRFTQEEWLAKALPGMAEPAMLAKSVKDPQSEELNRMAGETIALRLNVDMNAHGLMGDEALGEAILVVGPLAGMTVAEVLEMAEQAVGGFPEKMERRGLNVDTLTLELGWLNTLAEKCETNTAFMRP